MVPPVLLVFVHLLFSLSLAHATCVPTETTDPRIVLEWPALTSTPEGFALTAWRLHRTGDAPTLLPPLGPEAVTLTDTVEPGAHGWQLKAQFTRTADGAVFLSDLAPLGDPPPCVVVLAVAPPPPTLLTVAPGSTLTGVPGLQVRWRLEGPDRPVRIERRAGTETALPWGHVGSVPGGFYFDFFALTAGTTYCYRTCLLNTDTPQCSEERCALFPPPP